MVSWAALEGVRSPERPWGAVLRDAAGALAESSRAALAGVETLLAGQLRAGRAARLDEATADVVYMLAVPFLGAGEAARLAAGAARRRHLRAVA